uniref:Titin n=1 Tax=Electrophorus electricus TaxID=8005 RepID=A0AAY5F2V8_ELEEL
MVSNNVNIKKTVYSPYLYLASKTFHFVGPPGPPGRPEVENIGGKTSTITWKRPADDGGSDILGYMVEKKERKGMRWSRATKKPIPNLHFEVQGLTEGAEYQFRVAAENKAGFGEPSEPSQPITTKVMARKSRPRESKHVIIREQSTLPEFDLRGICQKTVIAKAGDDIMVEVPVTGRPKPTITWQKDNQPLKLAQRTAVENTSTSTILTISECLRNDSGVYTMTGKNIVGSVTDNIIVKVHDVPGPPKGPIKLDKIERTSIEFSWESPENDGGVPINNYVVEIRETTSQTWVELSSLIIRTTFKATHLTTGVEYQFRVKAKNRYGAGPPIISETVVAAYPFKAPGPPGTPKVVAFTKDTMTVGWNEPVNDGGSEVIGYHVERKDRNSIIWQRISKAVVVGNLFKTTGLESGTAYEFRVMAENVAGIGKPSKSSEPMLALDPVDPPGQPIPIYVSKNAVTVQPGPPGGPLKVSDITAEKCVLTWAPPADDGGANIKHYVIEKRESSRLAWTNVVTDLLVTQYQVTKLLKGNEYIFRVMAVNKYGVGEPLESDPTIADNPYVPPDPPQTPEITAVTKDSLVLCWGAPANNGGSEITNYGIERRDRLSFRWVKCNKQKVTDLHFKVTGLVPGHEYEFRVTAENAAGVSLPSPSTPYVKATDTLFKPGPPGNPRILDTTSSSITLAWNKPVYDGGSAITGYIVETCLPGTDEEQWTIVSPKDGLKGTSFTIINLKKNQEYKINVSAVNNEGIGEAASVPGSPKAEERLLPPEIDLDADLRKVVNIRACNTLRLFVLIRGRPSPEVKWSRENDEPLDRATIESTSSFTSLIVGNVNRFDSGKYNLTVENNSGSKTASVMVRVLDTPGAPQNLKISNVTKESVSLVWDPPINDGGSKIKNYIVEKREATRKAYATINANCHKTSWTVDQLQEGCNYYFRVLAENEYGIGLPIETIESVKVSEKPLPPGKITLQDVTKTSVTFKGSEKWTQAVVVKETEAVISGLTHGEEYMFRVSARNEKGTSEPRQLGVPVIVKDLVITPSAKLLFSTFSVLAGEDLTIDIPYIARPQAAVSWVKDAAPLKRTTRVNFSSTETQLNLVIKEACRDDVGKYSIKLSNTRDTSTINWTVVAGSLARTKIKAGKLKTGTEYQFRITAENRHGKSSQLVSECLTEDKKYEFHVIARNAAGVFSLPSYSTGPITAKDEIEPPRISIDPQYTQTIIVNAGETFKIDADVHGKPVPTIYWMKGDQELGNTIYREIKNTDNFACLSVKEAKLADSGQYTLLLKNPGGEKAVHVNVSVLDKPGAPEGPIFITGPGPPHNPKLTDTTKSSVSLAWGKPIYDGGCEIQGYIVESCEVKSSQEGEAAEGVISEVWAICTPPTGVKSTCFTVEKLKEKQEYKFRVCAVNKVGIGEHADVAGHIVPEDKTEEPDLDIDLEF